MVGEAFSWCLFLIKTWLELWWQIPNQGCILFPSDAVQGFNFGFVMEESDVEAGCSIFDHY